MAGMGIDASELRAFASDLLRGAAKVPAEARAVVSKGALNIKNQLQKEMSASTHFRGIAYDFSYDLSGNAAFTEAEIGPHSGGSPGSLANIAYFGSPSKGGGGVPDPRGALEAEIPNVEKYLADVVDGML